MSWAEKYGYSLLTMIAAGAIIGPNPGCSAGALFVLLAYKTADKYFHDSFFDENKKAIAQLKTEVTKLTTKQSQADLKSALSRNG